MARAGIATTADRVAASPDAAAAAAVAMVCSGGTENPPRGISPTRRKSVASRYNLPVPNWCGMQRSRCKTGLRWPARMRASTASWSVRCCPAAWECIIGLQVDPLFGPMVMVGLGGVMTETGAGHCMGVSPRFSEAEAQAMVGSLRLVPVLARPPRPTWLRYPGVAARNRGPVPAGGRQCGHDRDGRGEPAVGARTGAGRRDAGRVGANQAAVGDDDGTVEQVRPPAVRGTEAAPAARLFRVWKTRWH